MKDILVKYQRVIRFLLLFLGTYGVFTALYFLYLSWSANGAYAPDFVTHLVAAQAESVLGAIGYEPSLQVDPNLPMVRVLLSGRWIGTINEGCNAVSVMILFVAFVVAFAQRFKKTLLFILGGLTLIYATNIIRIVIICIALDKYPAYSSMLHDIVFPGLIYGMVFLLWLFWVRNISMVSDE